MSIDTGAIGASAVIPTTQNGSQAGTGKTTLDRDAFLKLLVAQLQHQDPLKPMEGTEYVAQLSQFAMVEQSLAQTAKLDVVSTQLTGLSNNEAASLVGKEVTIRGKGIAFDGLLATGASVSLGGAAQKVQVAIKDENGHVVRTLELGAKPAGAMGVSWDGKGDNGEKVPAGKYQIDVKATGEGGSPIAVSQEVTSVVSRVTFEKGYPELVLASGNMAPISDLVSVGQAPVAAHVTSK